MKTHILSNGFDLQYILKNNHLCLPLPFVGTIPQFLVLQDVCHCVVYCLDATLLVVNVEMNPATAGRETMLCIYVLKYQRVGKQGF